MIETDKPIEYPLVVEVDSDYWTMSTSNGNEIQFIYDERDLSDIYI